MKYSYTLGVQNPSVQKKIASKQFELSEQILDMRFNLSLKVNEMAEISGISINEYAKLEFGDPDVPLANYENALKKITDYSKDSESESMTTVIEKAISNDDKSKIFDKLNFYNYNTKTIKLYKLETENIGQHGYSQTAEAA